MCNLYCMFLWERGERKEREVSPRSCSAPYSPEGNVERGGKGERGRQKAVPATATYSRIEHRAQEGG